MNSELLQASQPVRAASNVIGGGLESGRAETIRETDGLWKNLANMSPEPVLICMDSLVTFANPAAIHILAGGSVACVLAKPFSRWVMDVRPEYFDLDLKSIQQGAVVPHREIRIRTNSGNTRTVEMYASQAIFRGLPTVQIFLHDITARVQVEREMVNALEDQQQRFGRELHDSVGQLLTAVQILSGNLVERCFTRGEESYNLAQKVAKYAAEASVRLREIHGGLAPFYLNREGLAAALKEFSEDVDLLPGPGCVFLRDNDVDVKNDETKLHLYRIAQESVNNALKYAEAGLIKLMLLREERDLVLQIEDDGKGFTPDVKRSTKSIGLNSMYYRARAIGAVLQVASKTDGPTTGTRVHCTIKNYFRD